MRIIAGTLKGRKLACPEGTDVRPTSSRAREAIFSILTHHKALHEYDLDGLPGARVADICCGSGAMGFEALSRGAVHATFLDKNSEVLKYVHQSSTQMNVQDKCVTRRSDATSLPPGSIPHTIAFVDPPYSQDITPAILTELHTKNWLAPKALVVTEIKAKQAFIPPSTYHILDERTYGAAQIYLLLYQPH